MTTLVSALADRNPGASVTLALLDRAPEAYSPRDAVRIVRLDCRGRMLSSVHQVAALVAREKPDILLSFLTRSNGAAILASRRAHLRCVVSERVNTSSHLGNGLKGRMLRLMVRLLYPRADAVVAVSQGVADELARTYHVLPSRLDVIHNPVDLDGLQDMGRRVPEMPLPLDFLVSVGRLAPNKAFDVLIRAFAAQPVGERHLVILGEGPERPRLAALARDLGVTDRVIMPGYVGNPHAVIARAAAYASASRSEGFPNALVEAMALGRPVIATDCASGPSEILASRPQGEITTLTEARSGILVPVDDSASLSEAMGLMADGNLRASYGHRARERVAAYAPEACFARYEALMGLAKATPDGA